MHEEDASDADVDSVFIVVLQLCLVDSTKRTT